MSITVNFRTSEQELPARRFPKNVPISIYGKVTGVLGLGEAFQHIRIEILNRENQSIFFDEDTTNTFGDYAFYVVFPNEDTYYTIVLTATYSVSGQDTARVPVAVGDVEPIGEAPKPEEQGNVITKYLPYALALGAIVLILYAARTVKQITA